MYADLTPLLLKHLQIGNFPLYDLILTLLSSLFRQSEGRSFNLVSSLPISNPTKHLLFEPSIVLVPAGDLCPDVSR